MQLRHRILSMIPAILGILPWMAGAQGTLQVSNLNQSPTGSAAIGSDSWIAQNFAIRVPDTNPYILESVQLLMNPASGDPDEFSISIYSAPFGSFTPQNHLGSLSGSINPSTGGVYTYSSSGIVLLSGFNYFALVTAGTPVAEASFAWSAANSYRGRQLVHQQHLFEFSGWVELDATCPSRSVSNGDLCNGRSGADVRCAGGFGAGRLVPQKAQELNSMRMRHRILPMILANLGLLPWMAGAQGTLQVSNLGQTPTGNGLVGSDSWIAQNFFILASDPNDYALNTVDLLMNSAAGSPSDFEASIYSGVAGGAPTTFLGSLSGSDDPSVGGIHSYTASGITLSGGWVTSSWSPVLRLQPKAPTTGVHQTASPRTEAG